MIIIAGALLAAPYVLYALRARHPSRLFALGLVVAALIYVAFALAAGDSRALLLELAGLAVFTLVAFIGVRWSAYVLALGWLAHVAWDTAASSHAPSWYPNLCIGFDILTAGAVLAAARLRREH